MGDFKPIHRTLTQGCLFYFQYKEQGMKRPIFIPSAWMPKRQTSVVVSLAVEAGNLYQTEVLRLEAKYGRALSKKETAIELHISDKVLAERIIQGRDIPDYRESASGRHVFPISAVAAYLTQGLVKTA